MCIRDRYMSKLCCRSECECVCVCEWVCVCACVCMHLHVSCMLWRVQACGCPPARMWTFCYSQHWQGSNHNTRNLHDETAYLWFPVLTLQLQHWLKRESVRGSYCTNIGWIQIQTKSRPAEEALKWSLWSSLPWETSLIWEPTIDTSVRLLHQLIEFDPWHSTADLAMWQTAAKLGNQSTIAWEVKFLVLALNKILAHPFISFFRKHTFYLLTRVFCLANQLLKILINKCMCLLKRVFHTCPWVTPPLARAIAKDFFFLLYNTTGAVGWVLELTERFSNSIMRKPTGNS